MDATKTEPKSPETPTLQDDSRTVADSSTAAKLPAIAAEIRDHELIRRIGQGSYGEVWLARNVMGTYRAVKIVYRAAFEHARPFEREFNGIQKFEPLSRSHDGFVDILQVGRTDEYFYSVMELADDVTAGQQIDPNRYEPKTLRSEVQSAADEKKKALPFEQCVELGLSLTQALGKLHDHGLIHRDIKPSNIIFVNGIAKLADIGLVAEQSEAKSFVGTEGFIPPEGPGTPQADIYSLGKVLYEIATGKDRHEFPALPTLLGDSATDTHLLEFNTIFLKACQSELKQRYQTCEQMRDDLLLLRSGKSVKRAQALERRLRWLAQLSVAAIALILLVFIGFFWARRQAQREAQLRARAEVGERAARENELAARRNLYAADMIVANHALRENNLGQAATIINRYAKSAGEDLRGFEWRYLWGLCKGDELRTFRGREQVADVAVAPDGSALIIAEIHHGALLWNLATGTHVSALSSSEGGALQRNTLALSPDGKLLAMREAERVVLFNTSEWNEFRSLDASAFEPSDNSRPVVFSADGKLLATSTGTGVQIWDCERWKEKHLFANRVSDFGSHLAFSGDGRRLIIASAEGLHAYDLSSYQLLGEFGRDAGLPISMKSCPPGDLLAVGYWDGNVRFWNLATLTELGVLSAHPSMCFGLAASADGKLLATGGGDQVIRVWDMSEMHSRTSDLPAPSAKLNIKLVTSLRGHGNQVWALAFTPDGRHLVSGSKDRTAKLWPLVKQEQEQTLEGAWQPLRFSTDQKELFGLSSNSEFSSWNLDNKEKTRTVSAPPEAKDAIALRQSPDGRYLVVLAKNQSIHLVKAESWQEVASLPPVGSNALRRGWAEVFLPQFSVDGRFLAFEGTNGVQIWNVETLTVHRVLTNTACPVLFFSDASVVATEFNQIGPAVGIWRLEDPKGNTNHEQVKVPVNAVITCVALSADGRMLATGSADNLVWLYDLWAHKEHSLCRGHKASISAIAFAPDGKTLASGSSDGMVRLVHVATGQEMLAFQAVHDPVRRVMFSEDGTTLVASSNNPRESLRLWRAQSFDEIAKAGMGDRPGR